MAKQVTNNTRNEKVETLFVPILKSSLPVTRVGKTADKPYVTVRENGQIAANSLASGILGGSAAKFVLVQWDAKNRVMQVRAWADMPKIKNPATGNLLTADDFFTPGADKTGGKNVYFGAAGLLNQLGYKFHESGNQPFDLTDSNEEKHSVSFHLPEGSLTPRPKQERKRKSTAPATASNAPASDASNTEEEEEESDIDLDETEDDN